MITAYYGSYDYWQLYHKVTFDGVNKLITINPGETLISVKNDLYSDWKEWLKTRDNSKFPIALRTIGGDVTDVAAGKYAGDIYFLMNGWRIVIPHNISIDGVLYVEEGGSPYIVQPGGGVIATVSNLVQTVVKTETIVAPGPTASQIASQVRIELTPELNKITSQIDGLTPSQQTMLTELYIIMGLDPTKPLVVTDTNRSAGNINQTLTSGASSETAQRV